MELEKEIENFNKKEIEKIYDKYKETKGIKVSLDKGRLYVFTMKKFEVFFRLYIDSNIQVYIRTNTVNSREVSNYDFFDFNNTEITDLNEYKKIIRLFFKNITKEVDNTLFAPEHHKEMIPDNATKEETDKGWYLVYEQRLLTKLDYNNKDDFYKWIEKVSDKKYIAQQKGFGK